MNLLMRTFSLGVQALLLQYYLWLLELSHREEKVLYMCVGTCCWIMRILLGKWLLFYLHLSSNYIFLPELTLPSFPPSTGHSGREHGGH